MISFLVNRKPWTEWFPSGQHGEVKFSMLHTWSNQTVWWIYSADSLVDTWSDQTIWWIYGPTPDSLVDIWSDQTACWIYGPMNQYFHRCVGRKLVGMIPAWLPEPYMFKWRVLSDFWKSRRGCYGFWIQKMKQSRKGFCKINRKFQLWIFVILVWENFSWGPFLQKISVGSVQISHAFHACHVELRTHLAWLTVEYVYHAGLRARLIWFSAYYVGLAHSKPHIVRYVPRWV